MRVVVVIAALGAPHAYAEPAAGVRDGVEREGMRPVVGASMRMRTDGPAVGVGVGAQLVHGDYALSVGLTRWQSIDDDRSEGSWELGVRGYRYLQLGPRTRAHVMASAAYESLERDGGTYGRRNLSVGVGLSTKLADGLVGWTQLTLEHRHWLERPPAGEDDDLALMLMFGLSF